MKYDASRPVPSLYSHLDNGLHLSTNNKTQSTKVTTSGPAPGRMRMQTSTSIPRTSSLSGRREPRRSSNSRIRAMCLGLRDSQATNRPSGSLRATWRSLPRRAMYLGTRGRNCGTRAAEASLCELIALIELIAATAIKLLSIYPLSSPTAIDVIHEGGYPRYEHLHVFIRMPNIS